MNYTELQNLSAFEKNQIVMIIDGLEDARKIGWSVSWNPEMDKEFGKTGKISSVTGKGIYVKMEESKREWTFPFNCLTRHGIILSVRAGNITETLNISQNLFFALKEGHKMEVLKTEFVT